MKFIITTINIFLITMIFFHVFKKSNTITETLDKGAGCPKNMEGAVYQQEATLDKFTNKLKDIDNGIIIMNNRLKENQKKIKKNQVELKSASNMVKNEANAKMKKLDSM